MARSSRQPSPSPGIERLLGADDRGFTLIEIMIVTSIIGIVVAIALPSWMRQRNLSQQRSCQENLSKLNGAKEQWAFETRQLPSAVPEMSDIYFSDGTGVLKTLPRCPTKGTYTLNAVAVEAVCSIVEEPYDHNAAPFADAGESGS